MSSNFPAFSKRYGIVKPPTQLVRDQAPRELRHGFLAICRKHNIDAVLLGGFICDMMHYIPETKLGGSNWRTVEELTQNLKWYEFYDLVESSVWEQSFAADVNELFEEYGIGWKITEPGMLTQRGDENHERLAQDAVTALITDKREVAAQEMRAAIKALSERPEPDCRNAVARAINAVESLARDVTGQPDKRLGQLTSRLPRPLDEVVAGLWDYASEQARHAREGQVIEPQVARLVVNICTTIISHLSGEAHLD